MDAIKDELRLALAEYVRSRETVGIIAHNEAALAATHRAVKRMQSHIALEVASDKTHANETARKAAIAALEVDDPELNICLKALAEHEERKAVALADLDIAKATLRTLTALAAMSDDPALVQMP